MTRKMQNKTSPTFFTKKVHESARKPTCSSNSVCEQTGGDGGMFFSRCQKSCGVAYDFDTISKFFRVSNKQSALILLFSEKKIRDCTDEVNFAVQLKIASQ